MGGYTQSSADIASVGAFDETLSGPSDLYVVAFSQETEAACEDQADCTDGICVDGVCVPDEPTATSSGGETSGDEPTSSGSTGPVPEDSSGPEPTGPDGDGSSGGEATATDTSGGATESGGEADEAGCGCRGAPGSAAPLGWLAGLWLLRRRRAADLPPHRPPRHPRRTLARRPFLIGRACRDRCVAVGADRSGAAARNLAKGGGRGTARCETTSETHRTALFEVVVIDWLKETSVTAGRLTESHEHATGII